MEKDGEKEDAGYSAARRPSLGICPFGIELLEDSDRERPGDEHKDEQPTPVKIDVDP
jgi:hypothetical protein